MVQRAQRTIERHYIYLFIYLFDSLLRTSSIVYILLGAALKPMSIWILYNSMVLLLGKKKKKEKKSDACEHSGPL
jgi:hypothetical protein